MAEYIIAPSLLSADFACLGQESQDVLAAGGDVIHLDVMDNHYVPNLTVGPLVCKALREYGIKAPIDAHLMVEPVDDLIVAFAKAGASYISFHPEASRHIDRSVQLILDNGCKAGLAFNPATPLDHLDYIIDKLDLILLMSVNPGFGGQEFIPSVLAKISKARDIAENVKKDIYIAVDGGVNINTIHDIATAGANFFVCGSAIFNTSNYRETINTLRKNI